MPALIDHLEHRLGHMIGGSTFDDRVPEITVAAFSGGQIDGAWGYSTVGLSNVPLRSRRDGRDLYLELIALAHSAVGASYGPLPSVLHHVGRSLVVGKNALLRGDIIPLGAPLCEGSRMVAMYAALPVYFDDAFNSAINENGRKVAIVWLIPVGQAEMEFVGRFGWRAFEEKLTLADPDLLDLNRVEIVPGAD